ncbi:inositol monophosphatase family protein [Albibacterium profundi]|uniref:Inositol-1-monophosphatase n=1 Tax=Albibacterium profundi TaxID=3134906 RepID=A0ABV5CK46_9SPHI
MIDLAHTTKQLIEACKETGDYIRNEYRGFSSHNIEVKGIRDTVSYVDKESERRLVEALRPLIDGAGFITEENTDTSRGEVYNWVIDPLDGTTNFVHKIPVFSVSVALLRNEELVVGVVYEINQDECFSAWKGGGAYLNGERIQVTDNQLFSESLIGTGLPFRDFEKLDGYIEVLKTVMQKTRGIRRIGSAAVDLAYTACGRFDAFFEQYLMDYDMAAGILIVQEAGGKVYDFEGGQNMLSKGNVVAGNPYLSEELLLEIKKHF